MRVVCVATEGPIDTSVARRICVEVNLEIAAVHGERGKGRLDRSLGGYNAAARHLNTDAGCAPYLRERLLATPSPGMVFRIAVHEVESWLMADQVSFARYFSVSEGLLTRDPESVRHPKEHLVNVVRRSRYLQHRQLPSSGCSAMAERSRSTAPAAVVSATPTRSADATSERIFVMSSAYCASRLW